MFEPVVPARVIRQVYKSILYYYMLNKKVCYASRKTLAKNAGVCVWSISKAIKFLEMYGFIHVHRTRNKTNYISVLNDLPSVFYVSKTTHRATHRATRKYYLSLDKNYKPRKRRSKEPPKPLESNFICDVLLPLSEKGKKYFKEMTAYYQKGKITKDELILLAKHLKIKENNSKLKNIKSIGYFYSLLKDKVLPNEIALDKIYNNTQKAVDEEIAKKRMVALENRIKRYCEINAINEIDKLIRHKSKDNIIIQSKKYNGVVYFEASYSESQIDSMLKKHI